MKRTGCILLTLVCGCKGTDKGTETGDVLGDTGPVVVDCEATLDEIDVEDGEEDVYYRRTFNAVFTEPAAGGVSATLTASDGSDLPVSITMDETGYNAVIDPGTMVAEETYVLDLDVCGSPSSLGFATSTYGGELLIAPEELSGNTYLFDLGAAEYVQPVGIGMIIGNYLSAPLLVGVAEANESEIGLIGAQGSVDDVTGEYSQATSLGSWDFGIADFEEQPWFWTQADQITIDYADVEVAIYNFEIEGTFEPDGSSIGGGRAIGLADTRNMGPLMELSDEPGAVCDLGASIGLECEPCPDGDPYCLTLEALFEQCELIEGLTIEEIE